MRYLFSSFFGRSSSGNWGFLSSGGSFFNWCSGLSLSSWSLLLNRLEAVGLRPVWGWGWVVWGWVWVVNWSRLVVWGWSWVVDWGGLVVDGGRLMVNWSRLVVWGWSWVVDWGG